MIQNKRFRYVSQKTEQCCGLAWLDARYPSKPLYHSPPSTGQGSKSMTKSSWVEIMTKKDHSAVTVMGKKDSAQGNYFNLSSNKSE